MKLTLGDIKGNISKLLSMASTDSRVIDYINEAQERLLYKGKWPGTYARFVVTSSNGCITWPRQLETIESMSVDEYPGIIRNEWYEYLESGPGLLDSGNSDDLTMVDRGDAVTFGDIAGIDKKLRLHTTVTADADVRVLLLGYDENGEWIRTEDDGTHIDGEYVTLTTSYVETSNFFTIVTGVQKPVTSGFVKVYEYDTTNATQRMIANYEPDETRPLYRRSLIPGIADEALNVVQVIGKVRFVPVRVDTDWMHIGYEAAIKEMVMSVRKAENNLPQEASIYEKRAVSLLQDQLMHYLGDGAVPVPRIQNVNTFGGGGVANIV